MQGRDSWYQVYEKINKKQLGTGNPIATQRYFLFFYNAVPKVHYVISYCHSKLIYLIHWNSITARNFNSDTPKLSDLVLGNIITTFYIIRPRQVYPLPFLIPF